jgi:hypothetical protein
MFRCRRQPDRRPQRVRSRNPSSSGASTASFKMKLSPRAATTETTAEMPRQHAAVKREPRTPNFSVWRGAFTGAPPLRDAGRARVPNGRSAIGIPSRHFPRELMHSGNHWHRRSLALVEVHGSIPESTL